MRTASDAVRPVGIRRRIAPMPFLGSTRTTTAPMTTPAATFHREIRARSAIRKPSTDSRYVLSFGVVRLPPTHTVYKELGGVSRLAKKREAEVAITGTEARPVIAKLRLARTPIHFVGGQVRLFQQDQRRGV